MKITEQQLLDGYDGISNGLNVISIINGQTIIWAYRDDGQDDCCPVIHDPANASYPCITLEYGRHGRIETCTDNLSHPNLATMQEDIRKIVGTSIYDY